jgi:abequosyltransferase
MKPLLTVGIPTYNRGKYLPETLESIIRQASNEVDILVCDNASTDDTTEVIARFQERFPRITYFRWPENMGADRNYLKVAELAQGEYCWFMGSDDIAEPGAIQSILGALKTYPQLAGISVNGNGYKLTFDNQFSDRLVTDKRLFATKLFDSATDAFDALGDYWGYLPGQVVNTQLWAQVVAKNDVTPYLNAYVHIYVMGKILELNSHWLYLDNRCVGWRGGNDSFLSDGRLKRLAIDVIGYEQVARGLYGGSHWLYHSLLKRISTKHVFIQICVAKRENLPASFFMQAFKMCAKAYWRYPQFWVKTAPVFFIPFRPFMALRAFYLAVSRKS